MPIDIASTICCRAADLAMMPVMGLPNDTSLIDVLAEALCDLVDFVEQRGSDATEDDDARALESAAFTLNKVPWRSVLGSWGSWESATAAASS